jgi:hypothetical protein
MGDKFFLQRIKEVGRILFWENKITAGLIYSGLLINSIVVIGLIILFKSGQDVLIGHYNVFFGIDKLIKATNKNDLWELLTPPIVGLFFLIVSVLMSIFFILQLDRTVAGDKKNGEVFVSNRAISFIGSRLLLIGAWVVQLILAVYLLAIWLIN